MSGSFNLHIHGEFAKNNCSRGEKSSNPTLELIYFEKFFLKVRVRSVNKGRSFYILGILIQQDKLK